MTDLTSSDHRSWQTGALLRLEGIVVADTGRSKLTLLLMRWSNDTVEFWSLAESGCAASEELGRNSRKFVGSSCSPVGPVSNKEAKTPQHGYLTPVVRRSHI